MYSDYSQLIFENVGSQGLSTYFGSGNAFSVT